MISVMFLSVLALDQAPLSTPKPTPKAESTDFVMPKPVTGSYYATASGPSKSVGWPTSLYGQTNKAPEALVPVPFFLAYQPPMEGASGSGSSGKCKTGNCGLFKKRGCYAELNGPGCGNFRTDAIFILGSSRAFFGEACRSGPTCPTPWDMLYGNNRPPQ